MNRLMRKFEANWANDISRLRKHYSLEQTDEEVSQLSYKKWKDLVTSKVEEFAFTELKKSLNELSQVNLKILSLNRSHVNHIC